MIPVLQANYNQMESTMMISLPLISVTIGSLLLTLVGLYVGWRSFRVHLLRLDLLVIRNRLWDEAREANQLNDKSYKNCRENLNLLIRHAHKIDLVTLALGDWFESDQDEAFDTPEASPEIAEAIQLALHDAGARMGRYVLNHRPFTGILLYSAIFCLVRMRYFVRLLRSVPVSVKETAARVRDFSVQPEQNSIAWIRNNGPSYAFRR